MTLLLVMVALCACGYYIVIPFVRLARRMPLSALTPPVMYFCAIGMGFMLIEISQMQRLMVFLGHPVYGLGVVLFTILLFSGIGSATVGAQALRSSAVVARVVALLTTLALAGLLTPLLTTLGAVGSHRHAHPVVHPAAGAAGVLHGNDVPARAKHLAPSRRSLLPFFWSANGITSMLASVLGMALSIEFGIASDICARRLLLRRLRVADRPRPPGEAHGCRCSGERSRCWNWYPR